MAQRAAKPKRAPQPRHRAKDSREYEHPIVPIEAITEASNELRQEHPLVTDEQAHFVHLIVQTGKNPAQLAKLTGKNKAWLYYNMSKAAVCDYRQAVAIRVLGWDSAAALSTMRSLLQSKSDYIKLEAARDLLDRAGLSLEPAAPRGVPISLTFNLGTAAQQLSGTPPVAMAHSAAGNQAAAQEPAKIVDVEVEAMGPVDPSQKDEGPLKNEAGFQGRGPHTHDQGLEVTSDTDPFTV